MSKKLTNKFLVKAYYNLLLAREIKENTFEDFSGPIHHLEEYAELAEQDIAYFNSGSLVDLLKEDPYYKIVQMVYKSEEKFNQIKPPKKIDKKLMN